MWLVLLYNSFGETHVSASDVLRLQTLLALPDLLHGPWICELRYLCLYGKHSNHWAIFPIQILSLQKCTIHNYYTPIIILPIEACFCLILSIHWPTSLHPFFLLLFQPQVTNHTLMSHEIYYLDDSRYHKTDIIRIHSLSSSLTLIPVSKSENQAFTYLSYFSQWTSHTSTIISR